jgi:hypothetical protein
VEYIGVRNKSYYNIVQNNIAEASSFTHTLSSNTVPVDSHGPPKALDKTNRVTLA